MRPAAIALGLSALLAGAAAGQDGAAPDAYRDAIRTFVKTGDAAVAIRPIAGWDQRVFDQAVAARVAAGDHAELEAGALMHLEVAIAIVGLSFGNAERHAELGRRLIDGLLPARAEDRLQFTDKELALIAQVRSTWLGVAGSVFLSVNATDLARDYFAQALKLTPKSAPVLTMAGAAEELDGVRASAEFSDSTRVQTRAERERRARWLSADRLYHRALDADPAYPLAQIRLGRLLFLQEQFKPARRWLEQGAAAAREPLHQYLAAMFMGGLQQHEKDYDGARESFERALAIVPRSQNAHVALAYLEMLAGHPNRAQTLVRSFTGTPQIHDTWWAYKSGTLDLAGLRSLRQRVRR